MLLAQAGAPFTTGFLGKFYVVEAAVDAHSYALAVIAMSTAAVAAFFYLRVTFLMFGTSADETDDVESASLSGVDEAHGSGVATLTALDTVRLVVPSASALALGIVVLVTVVFGIWPAPIIDFARLSQSFVR